MGNGCIKYELLDENQMITESRDLKGQYNDYINYGLFDLMLCKKIKIDEGFEIEGNYIEKNDKLSFFGMITKEKVEFEVKCIDLQNKKFSGKYEPDSQRYLGSYSSTKNEKSKIFEGKFWIKIIEKNFWLQTYKSTQPGLNVSLIKC